MPGQTERKVFEREELIELRERAEELADVSGTSPTWQRAYLALANAADHLDAMISRSTVVMQELPHAR